MANAPFSAAENLETGGPKFVKGFEGGKK